MTSAATVTPPSASRLRGWVVVEAAALVLLLALALQGFTSFVDLHTADEVGYHELGQRMLDGDFQRRMFALSPVYSFAYGVADALLGPAGIGGSDGWLQDGMFVACSGASAFALWWALRGFLAPSVAFVAAVFWAASGPFVDGGLGPRCNVYLFTAALAFLALGALARGRTVAGLALLAVAALNRVELAPWLGATAVVAAAVARRRDRPKLVAAVAGMVFACVMAALHMTVQEARQRAWIVFSQHFASGWGDRHAGVGVGEGVDAGEGEVGAAAVAASRVAPGDPRVLAVLQERLATADPLLRLVLVMAAGE